MQMGLRRWFCTGMQAFARSKSIMTLSAQGPDLVKNAHG